MLKRERRELLIKNIKVFVFPHLDTEEIRAKVKEITKKHAPKPYCLIIWDPVYKQFNLFVFEKRQSHSNNFELIIDKSGFSYILGSIPVS